MTDIQPELWIDRADAGVAFYQAAFGARVLHRVGEGGMAAYVTRFDSVRVPAADYQPVWVGSLADDVTIEGSAMNGAVQDAEAVRSIVTFIRALYDGQEFSFAGPYGENGFLEDYTARVVASSSATSSWSPATPPGRRSTSWPATGPGPPCCSYPGW